LGFKIGVQIPGVVEYLSITKPALDHRHGPKGLGLTVQPGLFFWRYRDRSS